MGLHVRSKPYELLGYDPKDNCVMHYLFYTSPCILHLTPYLSRSGVTGACAWSDMDKRRKTQVCCKSNAALKC